MRDLIATYESNVAVKALMFLFFSKWAAGFGCAYQSVLAVEAFQRGGMMMALLPASSLVFNLLLLARLLLNYLRTAALCAA